MAAVSAPLSLSVPGDKSISHRLLILAALAEGTSRIRGILVSEDTAATAGVLRACGVSVPPLANDIEVKGVGLRGLMSPGSDLECGNSGTTARLMAGVVAGHPMSARFLGDRSLSRRPMLRVARPLRQMGATVELTAGDVMPMTVTGGRLSAIDWELEQPSAQVRSAILLAALCGRVEATVRGGGGARDHTERLMAALEAPISRSGDCVFIGPAEAIAAFEADVPGDPSSAAFLVAAGLLARHEVSIENVALNPSRTAFFDVLQWMGASVSIDAGGERLGEPVGQITVKPSALRGTTVGAERVPALIDELPLLACIAAHASGETVVRGAGELRHKESDRIAAIINGLRAVGAEAEELPDGFVVRGSERPLRGRVVTHGDHRVAMAFGVLGSAAGNEIEVDDPACVAVSYPDFWTDLATVRG